MNSHTLQKANDLHSILSKYRRSAAYKFRGQSNSEWKLIPRAGRSKFTSLNDYYLFRHWKRRAFPFLASHQHNDWQLLSIAQHNGLPTRLLDWSHTPLTAVFFACHDNQNSDGAVWIVSPKSYSVESEESPFETKENGIVAYQPSGTSPRIANQFGYFTIHNPPTLELTRESFEENKLIERIVIPKELKKEIMFILNQYGVNYLTIYPDLEGLSKHLTWFAEHFEYWDGSIEELRDNPDA